MSQCTNDIAVASIALIIAATSLVNVLIAYFQSRRLEAALLATKQDSKP